jgi:hypothetical protein
MQEEEKTVDTESCAQVGNEVFFVVDNVNIGDRNTCVLLLSLLLSHTIQFLVMYIDERNVSQTHPNPLLVSV